jgi:quercetin dioxygenase-like cupin family protein
MKITHLSDAAGYDPASFVAEPLLDGSKSNVRIIRLSAGQTLPPHTHGVSDLMLFVVEGTATMVTEDGPTPFTTGSLVFFRGDEELLVSNDGEQGVTLLAFLAPAFPPAAP